MSLNRKCNMNQSNLCCQLGFLTEVNIDIYNNTRRGADIQYGDTNGTYNDPPSILGTEGAKAQVYVSSTD